MPDIWVIVQTTGTVLTALSALGIFKIAFDGWQLLREHDRVLHGEDSVEGWNGIVPMVRKNRECIEELKDELDDTT